MNTPSVQRGSILLLVLVFGAIFFILLTSLASFALTEHKAAERLEQHTKALSIAEAGLEYYAWFLSHFPTDFTNGTGEEGPYEEAYTDDAGNPAGTYTLSVAAASACGSTQSIDITSRGDSLDPSSAPVTLTARYAAPSAARYAIIVNNSSNPGVSFADIGAEFPALKTTAQSTGYYLPRFSSPVSSKQGYHLIFNEDGTVTVNRVTSLTTLRSVQPIDGSARFINDYTLINTESYSQTFSPNSDCGLIFVEDNLWLEGTVKGKLTVVAANISDGGVTPEVVVRDDITYATDDGSSSLTVIGKHNILIGPDSPMDLTLHGIFVAQSGAFGRNNYYGPSRGCTGVYEPRGKLTIRGSIVSNLPTSTKWPDGCGSGAAAGYQTQPTSVDPQNATNPSPFTPITSTQFEFVTWHEQ